MKPPVKSKNILAVLYDLASSALKSAKDGMLTLGRIEVSLRAIQVEQLAQRQILDEILTVVIPPPAVGFVFDVEFEDGEIQYGVTNVKFTNTQKVHIPIKVVDKRGEPAPIDGVPVCASSDETIFSTVMDADNAGVTLVASGPKGAAKLSVTADADLGEGVQKIFGELDVEIEGGAAVGFVLVPDAPVEQ